MKSNIFTNFFNKFSLFFHKKTHFQDFLDIFEDFCVFLVFPKKYFFTQFLFLFSFFSWFSWFFSPKPQNSVFSDPRSQNEQFLKKSGGNTPYSDQETKPWFSGHFSDSKVTSSKRTALLIPWKTMSETRSGASRVRRVPPLQSAQNHMIFKLRYLIPPQMTLKVENTHFFIKKVEKIMIFLENFWDFLIIFFIFEKTLKNRKIRKKLKFSFLCEKNEIFVKISDFFVKKTCFILQKSMFYWKSPPKPAHMDWTVHWIPRHGEESPVPTISGALARPGGWVGILAVPRQSGRLSWFSGGALTRAVAQRFSPTLLMKR